MILLKYLALFYLLGVVVCFILLRKEVNDVYRHKSSHKLNLSVFRNCWNFWSASWYGVLLILIKRSL